jgi:flavin-dependent dehydrogenase
MSLTPTPDQPLVIVGAGPVGLAAAAHAVERGLPVTVLEGGPTVGAAVLEWGHVRLFSPWSELVDDAAARLLEPTGWVRPAGGAAPTGREWVEAYLRPLAEALVDRGAVLRVGGEVVGLARLGRDRLVAQDREEVPFAVHVRTSDGGEEVLTAAAVVDASGTWGDPAPAGAAARAVHPVARSAPGADPRRRSGNADRAEGALSCADRRR